MQVAQQQTLWDYALAKIDRIYVDQKESKAKKRLQAIRKHRRQLLIAKSGFQKELDKAVSPKMQAGLGMVVVPQKRLPQFDFGVCFEFFGEQWLITRKRSLFGYQWQFGLKNQKTLALCTTRDLEHQLCYALGQYKNSVGSKVSVLRLLPSSQLA